MYISKTASSLDFITESDFKVTKDMTMKKSTVQQVGENFVRLYYARMNQAPESLHKLYGQNSSYVHGGVDSEGRPVEAVYGQAEIHKRVMALNFKDCQTEIRRVDAQATLGEGVVVQAMGELSTNMQPMRKFVQTFVLAPEGIKKFYIHNDLFQYQDEVLEDTESLVKVEDLEECVPSSTASSQPEVPEEEVAVSPEPEPEVEKDGEMSVKDGEASVMDGEASVMDGEASMKDGEASVMDGEASMKDGEASMKDGEASVMDGEASMKDGEASVKDGEASVKDGEASVKDGDASMKDGEASVKGGEASVKDGEASVKDGEASVKDSEASAVKDGEALMKDGEVSVKDGETSAEPEADTIKLSASGSSVAGSSVTVLPVPVPPFSHPMSWASVTAKLLPPTGPVPISAQRPLRRKVQRSGREGKQGEKEGRRVVQYPDAQQLFIGNLTQDVEKGELKEFFQQYGTVLEVNIIRGVKNPNFGFVVFDNAESVKNIISNKPVPFRGDIQLHLREKKTRPAQEGGVNGGGPRVVRYPDAQQLFVGNIPQDVDKSKLTEFFEQYGTVLEVQIHSSGGKHPNFGFVVFDNTEPIKNILRNKRLKFRGGVWLNVGEKKTRPAQEVNRRDPRPHGGPDGLRGPREQGVGEGGPRGPPTHSGKKDHVLDPCKVPGPTRPAAPPCARKAPNKSQRPREQQQPIGRQPENKKSKQKV